MTQFAQSFMTPQSTLQLFHLYIGTLLTQAAANVASGWRRTHAPVAAASPASCDSVRCSKSPLIICCCQKHPESSVTPPPSAHDLFVLFVRCYSELLSSNLIFQAFRKDFQGSGAGQLLSCDRFPSSQ